MVSTRQPLVPGQLEQVLNLSDLSLSSVLVPRDPMLWDLEEQGDHIVISCFGSEVSFPAASSASLIRVLHAGPDGVAVADLDDRLDVDERLVLARRLVIEGLAEVVGVKT